MKKDNPLGFSLIELLVVVAIIAILTVIGIAVFGNVSKNARDAKRKADVEAIVKALENQFDPESGKYPDTLEDGFFTADKKPEKPEGDNYDISWTGTETNHTGFKVCAALDDGSTQYCKQSSQGKFVAAAEPPPVEPPPGDDPPVSPAAPRNLVGFWNFNEGQGYNIVVAGKYAPATDDSSDMGNDGLWYGSSSHYTKLYSRNILASYTGIFYSSGGDFVDLRNPASLPSGNEPKSVCVWANSYLAARRDSLTEMVFSYGTDAPGQDFYIGRQGSTLIAGSSEKDIQVTDFWKERTWQFICLTFDTVTATLYTHNGTSPVELAKVPKWEQWNLVKNKAYIGRHVNDANYWNGWIDDVRIYSQGLTFSEVDIIYRIYGLYE